MKRGITILLLLIYLYDLGGYLGVRQYLVYCNDNALQKQAENGHFSKQELVEIKVPVSMPDASDWSDFENIEGQIQFENVAYNYVQLKVTSNALFLKCIPHKYTSKLIDQNIIWATPIKNIPSPPKDHFPLAGIIFMNGFSPIFQNGILQVPVINLPEISNAYNQLIIDRHIDVPTQPPKLICC